MLHQQLPNDWIARLRRGSLDPMPRFTEHGIIWGAGTVLLARDGGGRRLQKVKGQEARLVALLSAACGEVLPSSVVGNIRTFLMQWHRDL